MPKVCTETYPSDSEYNDIFNTYPYSLSDFQKYAIEAIVEGHHVLSCAHTGSGKTLAAEFAIQHFTSLGKKVIYTSPIKALSNQKYYEFTKKYPNITFGLMTGDIKTNPCADVIIMTTEILMNRLFTRQNAETMPTETLDFQMNLETELACVVFDEVHYINDQDRGHVWEQTIMMLPPHVQMVMLSATIDNPVGFAEWCESCQSFTSTTCKKQVYLAYTDQRVVPLTHYVYFATTEEPFKKIRDKEQQQIIRDSTNQLMTILSSSGKFNEHAYHKMKKMANLFDKERFYMKRKFVLNHLAEHLRDNEMLPAIAFVFSRKHVEQCAKEITANVQEFDTKVPYTMRHECEQIVRKFPNFREYLELPEFNELVALLEKGIGIHHSGMIPVLREIVEIMISKKHVKLLFATESFAIGLDCPIRTAIFTSLQKFTSEGLRYLHAHEYTQMAGRAGRRGIDTVGHVIHLNNLFREQPDIESYKTVLGGKPQQLVSKFHVTYQMVLNLIKNEQNTAEKMAEYANSTMWAKSLDAQIVATELTIKEKMDVLQKKQQKIEELRSTTTFVPGDVCEKYNEWSKHFSMYSQKKRKEIEREMASLKNQYRDLLAYCEKYKELAELEKELKQEQSYFEYLKETIVYQIGAICDILANDFHLICKSDDEYALTELGRVAANMAEIHPVIGANVYQYTNAFESWTAADFIMYLSCFTQIKVDEEFRRMAVPDTIDRELRDIMKWTQNKIEELEDMETKRQIYTGICYKDMMTFDLVEEISQWTRCETEQQCKYFIQTVLADRGISVGDFTKAVLKIATIAREWETVFCKDTSVLYELSQIESMILKYITTCQSLYV